MLECRRSTEHQGSCDDESQTLDDGLKFQRCAGRKMAESSPSRECRYQNTGSDSTFLVLINFTTDLIPWIIGFFNVSAVLLWAYFSMTTK
jgi:hypothetical protein